MSKGFEVYCFDGDNKSSKGCTDTFGEAAKLAVSCAADGKEHEIFEHRNPDAWVAWVKAGHAGSGTIDNNTDTCGHSHEDSFVICCDEDVVHCKTETLDHARALASEYAAAHHTDLVVYDASHVAKLTTCCHGHEVQIHSCARATA